MSSHSNVSEAHNFFYQGVDNGERHEYSGCRLSYDGCDAYSYSTIIAKVIVQKGYKKATTQDHTSALTLVSSDYMSATTCRHIALVREASPFNVVRVPMQRGNSHFEPSDLKYYMLKELERLQNHFNHKEAREAFFEIMQSRKTIRDLAAGQWAKAMCGKEFAKYENVDVNKIAEDIRKSNLKAVAEKAKKTREIKKKYLNDKSGKDYIEFVRALFDPMYISSQYPFSSDERSFIRKEFADSSKAYVWVAGDEIVTSKHVRVPIEEAKIALMAWAHGKDMRRVTVSRYVIVKYQGNEIQIGCHHIPRENMLALYESVMGKKFVMLKPMGEEQRA